MRGRIPARFAPYLFGAFLSGIMVSVVSAVVLLVNEGFTADFAAHWLKALLTTWPIAFPTVLLVAPTVRKCVNYLTSPR
jgi:hypothetical protein